MGPAWRALCQEVSWHPGMVAFLSEELTLEEQPSASEELAHHQHWLNVAWEEMVPAPSCSLQCVFSCPSFQCKAEKEETTAATWTWTSWPMASLDTHPGVCEMS